MLLGYSWITGALSLYLLRIGSHEHFYSAQEQADKMI
ncbi:hypothetical protein AB6G19_17785 [Providencia manganoxydans]